MSSGYPYMGVPQYPYMGVRWHPCMGAQVALLALPPHSRRGCKELFVILGFIYILLRYLCSTFIIDGAIRYLGRGNDIITYRTGLSPCSSDV